MAFTFTDENLEEIYQSEKPLVIDFWATWCGPCKRMAPTIDELADQYSDQAIIGKYNIEDNNELTSIFRIMSVPTILFFKNGAALKAKDVFARLAGSQSKPTLEGKIQELLG